MAIQLNPLSDSGLAQLAGSRLGYMNLPVQPVQSGGLLEGLAQGINNKAELQYKYAQLQNMLKQTQLQGSNQLANTALGNQGQLAQGAQAQAGETGRQQQMLAQQAQQAAMDRTIKQQQVNQEGSYQQGQLGIQQGQLGIQQQLANQQGTYQQGELSNEQQKIQQEQQMNQFKMQMSKDQVQLQKEGASAATFLMVGNGITDPNKLDGIQQQYINMELKNGDISADEANQLKQLSPDQRKQFAMSHMLNSGLAKDMQSIPGLQASFAGGSNLSAQNRNDLIKQNAQQGQVMQGANQLLMNWNPDYGTLGGASKSLVGETAAYVPGISSIIPGAEDARQFNEDKASFSSTARTTALNVLQGLGVKRISDQTVKALDPMIPTGKEDKDTQFGKLVSLRNYVNDAQQYRDKLITQGMVPNSDQMTQAMNDHLATAGGSNSLSVKTANGSQKVTLQNVEDYMKKSGKSYPEVMQMIMSNQP